MADKVFCGRAFTPRSQYAVSETSFNLDDIELMRRYAEANDGRVTLRTSKAKSGKLYSEIDTYKKNVPGQSPQSAHRSGEADRPEPPQQPQPEDDAAFDGQIPF